MTRPGPGNDRLRLISTREAARFLGLSLDRFYRLEKSRTTPGSGLGLALVKAVADLHGAELTLADNQPGLRVEVGFAG